MAAAAINDITIEYEDEGSGAPVLLIMGMGEPLITWPSAFVDDLVARGFRVIRYDNRDTGRSTMIDAAVPTPLQIAGHLLLPRFSNAPYLLADMADDAAALLDHLDIERAHVVGVSMGGMIAQSLAIAHPHRVASLASAMSHTGDRKHGRPRLSALARLAAAMARHPDPTAEGLCAAEQIVSGPHFDAAYTLDLSRQKLARDPLQEGVGRHIAAIAASPDRTVELSRLDVPALVLHGALDPLVTLSGGLATAKAIPGARLIVYPDMAHDVPRNRWTEIIDEIVQNTRRAQRRASADS